MRAPDASPLLVAWARFEEAHAGDARLADALLARAITADGALVRPRVTRARLAVRAGDAARARALFELAIKTY